MTTAYVDECIAVLQRTPATLSALLRDLPEPWISATDGPGTWSAYDVVGHLVHVERADWVPRIEIILQYGVDRVFDPIDREAMFTLSRGKELNDLLDEFTVLRQENLSRVRALSLSPEQLDLRGNHPAFGLVTMRQLLATWTAHDLSHLVQVSRTMARRYKVDVGPWAQYLSVMNKP